MDPVDAEVRTHPSIKRTRLVLALATALRRLEHDRKRQILMKIF
jgi:hypothetical protein